MTYICPDELTAKIIKNADDWLGETRCCIYNKFSSSPFLTTRYTLSIRPQQRGRGFLIIAVGEQTYKLRLR